jgi:molybdenum cofactor cytidylyltransferase
MQRPRLPPTLPPSPHPGLPSRVGGILLAAGRSLRLPGARPKQLLDWQGEALVRRVVRRALASKLASVVVVVGHAAGEVERAIADLGVEIVRNPRFSEGQSTSVHAGLARLEQLTPACNAAVFLPADLPHLEADLIDRLIVAWEGSGAAIVVPAFEGRRGAPVLFDRRLFAELAAIEGDTGGRQLFPAHEAEIAEVELESVTPLLDIDTEEDLGRLGR